MIGGRVLDSSALVAFASQRSVYAAAVVWTATEESIVLVIPSTVVTSAWVQLAPGQRDVLEVLLGLPVTVVDELSTARAKIVGELAAGRVAIGDVEAAHVAACALDRGWLVFTGQPERYDGFAGALTIEDLP